MKGYRTFFALFVITLFAFGIFAAAQADTATPRDRFRGRAASGANTGVTTATATTPSGNTIEFALDRNDPRWKEFMSDFKQAWAPLKADADFAKMAREVRKETDKYLAEVADEAWDFWRKASSRGSTDKFYALFDKYAPTLDLKTLDAEGMMDLSPREILWCAVRAIRDAVESGSDSKWLRDNFPRFSKELREIRDEAAKDRAALGNRPATTAAERGRDNLVRDAAARASARPAAPAAAAPAAVTPAAGAARAPAPAPAAAVAVNANPGTAPARVAGTTPSAPAAGSSGIDVRRAFVY